MCLNEKMIMISNKSPSNRVRDAIPINNDRKCENYSLTHSASSNLMNNKKEPGRLYGFRWLGRDRLCVFTSDSVETITRKGSERDATEKGIN